MDYVDKIRCEVPEAIALCSTEVDVCSWVSKEPCIGLDIDACCLL